MAETTTPGFQQHVSERLLILTKRLKAESDLSRNGDPLGMIGRVIYDAEYFRYQLRTRTYPDETIRYTISLLVKRLIYAEEFANNSRGVAEAQAYTA